MIEIKLSRPTPSTNSLYRNKSRGGRARTKDYNTWLNAMAWDVEIHKKRYHNQIPIKGPFIARVIMKRPSKLSDVDNRGKAALDLMQKTGIVDNDKEAEMSIQVWDESAGDGTIIQIMPIPKGKSALDCIEIREPL